MRVWFALLISACASPMAGAGDSGPPDAMDTADAATPDDVAAINARWRSLNVSVSNIERTASTALVAPKLDWYARADVRAGAVILTPEYGLPATFNEWRGDVAIATETPFGRIVDHWKKFTFDAGSSNTGVASGLTEFVSGDGVVNGTIRATFELSPDRSPPIWSPFAEARFADQPLPWDPRAFLASEPYEGEVSISYVFPAIASKLAVTRRTSSAWGTARELGLDVLLRDWDLSGELQAIAGDLADLTDNHLDGAPRIVARGAAVSRAASASWSTSAYLWGAAKQCTPAPCIEIGPFDWDACARGTEGGFAVRFAGGGAPTVEVRATSSTMLSAAPFAIDVASPGKITLAMIPATPTWTLRSDGTFDASWTIAAPASVGAETGIALSGGGRGPAKPSSCANPRTARVTVRVTRIAI